MRSLGYIFSLLFVFGEAYADFLPAETCFHAISDRGDIVAKVFQLEPTDGEGSAGSRVVSIHEFERDSGTFKRTESFTLDKAIEAHFCFVDSTGEFVILININHGSAGVTLINSKSKKTKRWPIGDFLTRRQMSSFAQTVTTDQWFDAGRFDEGVFRIFGPSRTIQRMPSSYSVMEGRDEEIHYRISVDLKKMSLTPKLNQEDKQRTDDQMPARTETKTK